MDDLYSSDARTRLTAAAALPARAARKLLKRVGEWPEHSPGAVNAWLVLATTKEPQWRDQLLAWREQPLSIGHPHEGFFYPDPLGFFAEVRRWAVTILRRVDPSWGSTEALALTTLVHAGDAGQHVRRAIEVCRPSIVLCLDEPAWSASRFEPVRSEAHHIPDPHRAGLVYQGLWGRLADGLVVGKAPQHPTMHRMYRAEDIDRFLTAAP
ncbi:MAG: hypothetical protein ACRD0G_10000 [Acidimicrobiales bacterium]